MTVQVVSEMFFPYDNVIQLNLLQLNLQSLEIYQLKICEVNKAISMGKSTPISVLFYPDDRIIQTTILCLTSLAVL